MVRPGPTKVDMGINYAEKSVKPRPTIANDNPMCSSMLSLHCHHDAELPDWPCSTEAPNDAYLRSNTYLEGSQWLEALLDVESTGKHSVQTPAQELPG